MLPRRGALNNQEVVGTKGLLVKEHAPPQAQRRIEVAVGALVRERDRIDAKGFQQTVCHDAVGPRAVDLQGAAVDQRQTAAELELITFGMAAEIIVIVENEDTRGLAPRAVEMRSR